MGSRPSHEWKSLLHLSAAGPRTNPGERRHGNHEYLSTHKVAGVKEAIEATGTKLLYLLSYSPDLNPIEMMFAKLKTLQRRAANRTIDDLWKAIGNILNQVTSKECRNYFENAGYGSN
ncbi:MAG: transposase [Geminicoccaceae bacterium]